MQGPGLLFSWIVMAPSQYRVHCLGSVDFKGFDVRCQIVLQNASSSLEQRMENCFEWSLCFRGSVSCYLYQWGNI